MEAGKRKGEQPRGASKGAATSGTWFFTLQRLIFSLVYSILEDHAYSFGNGSFLHSFPTRGLPLIAKDRGHTNSNGNQNCLVADRVSCSLQMDRTVVGICTLLHGSHMNAVFLDH